MEKKEEMGTHLSTFFDVPESRRKELIPVKERQLDREITLSYHDACPDWLLIAMFFAFRSHRELERFFQKDLCRPSSFLFFLTHIPVLIHLPYNGKLQHPRHTEISATLTSGFSKQPRKALDQVANVCLLAHTILTTL